MHILTLNSIDNFLNCINEDRYFSLVQKCESIAQNCDLASFLRRNRRGRISQRLNPWSLDPSQSVHADNDANWACVLKSHHDVIFHSSHLIVVNFGQHSILEQTIFLPSALQSYLTVK